MEKIDLKKIKPDVRYLNDMSEVIYDTNWLKKIKKTGDQELYYMYRGISLKEGIRYDVTVIPAKMMGKEFIKTKGHTHIGNYHEVYAVLEGKAIYLIQKNNKDNVEDVCAIYCRKGDAVIIPGDYGHVTINYSKNETLKMANWIAADCKSDYSLFEKMGGACYYYTIDGWIKNVNYSYVPKIRFQEPLKTIPDNLEFLKKTI